MALSATTLAVRATTALAALVLLAGCGSDSGAGSDDSPQVTITSPSDGADVAGTFELTWDTDVELGEPDTGRDHVHVFVDGQVNDYTVVGGNEFMIEGLSPGKHTVNVSLQHADHSSAGAEDEVDVTVGTDAGPTDTPSSGDSTPPPRYDY
jgi:hypothetical protein